MSIREVVKKRIFYGQAFRKGGTGGSDRKQMWKSLPISSIEIWFFDAQNTFYLIVRGLKNAFFWPITPPLYRYPTI